MKAAVRALFDLRLLEAHYMLNPAAAANRSRTLIFVAAANL
jgi:hypothetical protein